MNQASFYCPQCQQMKLFQSKPMNHVLHLLASVFLCGLWLPIWALSAMAYTPQWHCSSCGYYDGEEYLRQPGLRQATNLAAQQSARERQARIEARSEMTFGERIADLVDEYKVPLIAVGVIAGSVGLLMIVAVSMDNARTQPTTAARSSTPTVEDAAAAQRQRVSNDVQSNLTKRFSDVSVLAASGTVTIRSQRIDNRFAQEIAKPVNQIHAQLKTAGFVDLIVDNGKSTWKFQL